MERRALGSLLLAAALASGSASGQPLPCAAPRVPVIIHMTGGAFTAEPRRPETRCFTRSELDGMRRSRNTWRCTPGRRGRPPECTAVGVPTAPPPR